MACDIGEKPLEYAKHNAEKYKVQLETRISDGFKNIDENSYDDANIAGMGGELIIKILTDVDFIKNKDKRYILQPMTSANELRKFLFENQFKIEKEDTIMDSGRVYSVMAVSFTGEKEEVTPLKIYMGEIIPNSPYSVKYAEKVVKDLRNKATGIKHIGEDPRALEEIIEEIGITYLKDLEA